MQGKMARTVGALFINSDGEVLLGLRSPSKKVWPVHWDTIGGHVENGESLDDALIREAREEVGVTPVEFRLIATVRERQPESMAMPCITFMPWRVGTAAIPPTSATNIRN